ncbi:lytic transglycosylase domain-containing protein [Sphingomonas sinipercae]|uniref:Lytic transglycosylase domain-containing protein n=1 Tax=Sphingomonas sinipercae TaxID=2714944 RepID=A0A6G7ZNG0_9SPHN|nr:lytic transglycosylase domain-containing protein [Sphingomonas sinipercae]QIL02473.1 lytic transglycosylase domain-containing protein [Sphingomonas sinipercae]
MKLIRLAPALALFAAHPALAQQDPLAPVVPPSATPPLAQPQPQPQVIVPPIVRPLVVPRDWKGVFVAIRAGDWAGARAGIETLPPSLATAVARAELYTAKNSPVVSLPEIQALLAQAPDLPQAEQLARMAIARGALVAPPVVARKPLISLPTPPTRYRIKPVAGEPLADALRTQLDPLIKADDAMNAELLVASQAPYLTPNARAEAWQRVAWAYYVRGDDANARRVADGGRLGATGDWAAATAWVSGLAAWRQQDCNASSAAFREVVGNSSQRELRAGAYYWAARSEQACRRPQAVFPLLKAAAESPESFYGLVARETLGTDTRIPKAVPVSTAAVERLPNVQRAHELLRIGEPALAEQMLRHQARIGAAADHAALVAVAKKMELPGTQYWLAINGQRGASVQAAERYPMPRWAPVRGWRIEPSLAFAHAIQESSFQTGVVSHAGAVGLMQVLPVTAASVAARNGIPYSPDALYDAAYNLEFGQSFIERMRGSAVTGGHLPKVIASYNAGPLPVGRWAAIPGGHDPSLWMESIPYWETRYYVPAVLRNLWVYEGLAGKDTPTLSAIAQHRWPEFPVANGR